MGTLLITEIRKREAKKKQQQQQQQQDTNLNIVGDQVALLAQCCL